MANPRSETKYSPEPPAAGTGSAAPARRSEGAAPAASTKGRQQEGGQQEGRQQEGERERKGAFGIVKETFSEFFNDDCTTMAAALAYYTVFSLPPLLVIVITVTGLFVNPQAAEQVVREQASGLVGAQGAEQIQTMIQNAGNLGEKGIVGIVLGVAGLLFGATGAFAQLQTALNRAWEIKAAPEGTGLVTMAVKRVLSLGMVLGVAFLLLVSLVLSTALSALSGWLAQFMPSGVSSAALFMLDMAVSLFVITLLFGAIFKVLPDAKVAWRDVWLGGFVTALLFVAGKFGIGFYLGQSNPGEAFGAAGSLALILVWIYYSAMIVFLGAEFTQSWAKNRGQGIEPGADAVRVSDEPAQA